MFWLDLSVQNSQITNGRATLSQDYHACEMCDTLLQWFYYTATGRRVLSLKSCHHRVWSINVDEPRRILNRGLQLRA